MGDMNRNRGTGWFRGCFVRVLNQTTAFISTDCPLFSPVIMSTMRGEYNLFHQSERTYMKVSE